MYSVIDQVLNLSDVFVIDCLNCVHVVTFLLFHTCTRLFALLLNKQLLKETFLVCYLNVLKIHNNK